MATCRNLPTASQVRKIFFLEYVGKQCRAHKLNKNVAYPKNRNSYVTKEIFTHRPRRLQKNTCSEVLVIPLWLFGKYIAYSGGHRFICISCFKKDNPATQDTPARGCCEGIWSAIFTQKALFLTLLTLSAAQRQLLSVSADEGPVQKRAMLPCGHLNSLALVLDRLQSSHSLKSLLCSQRS